MSFAFTYVVTLNGVVGNSSETIDLQAGSTSLTGSFSVIRDSVGVLLQQDGSVIVVNRNSGASTDHKQRTGAAVLAGQRGGAFASDGIGGDLLGGRCGDVDTSAAVNRDGRGLAEDGGEEGDSDDGKLHFQRRLW